MAEVRVLMMPPFKRAYNKLYNNQKLAVDRAVSAIVAAPELGQSKRGDLASVSVYKFDCAGRQYLLAYEWNSELRILRALGVHENFYRNLKRNG